MRWTASPLRLILVALLLVGLATTFGAPVPASSITGDATADATAWNGQRKIVRDSFGNLYVALQLRDPVLERAVRILQSEDNGLTWATLPRVPDSVHKMSAAALAIDGANRVHLAWTELAVVNLQVFHVLWEGGEWSTRTQVSGTPGYSGFPATAIDRQDRLHIAWHGFDGSTDQVYYRVRAPNGTWEPAEIVSQGLRDANNPALSLGPDDRPHVAWFLLSDNRLFVAYKSRDAEWSQAAMLSDPLTFALDPSLAVASDGVVLATWTELHSNGTHAVVARHQEAGNWSSPVSLAWFPSGGHPVASLDGQDRGYVFWEQEDNAIRYRVFNGSWGPPVLLPANGTASFPSARWAAVANPLFAGANRLDVMWTEETDGTYAVAFAGVEVPPAGQPPGTFALPVVPLLLSAFVLVGVLWILRRRLQRIRREP